MAKLVINNDKKMSTIAPETMDFSEHLGRCIYEGLYVWRGFRYPECQRNAHRW